MATALSRAGVAHRMKAPVDYLRPIAGQIREALAPRGGRGAKACAGALECAGSLCRALHEDWQPYMAALLEPMAQTGLSGAPGWRLGTLLCGLLQ